MREHSARCSGPAPLTNKTWAALSSFQFACPPHVALTRDSVLCSPDDTCHVACRVRGSPTPGVRWMVNKNIISDTVDDDTFSRFDKLCLECF